MRCCSNSRVCSLCRHNNRGVITVWLSVLLLIMMGFVIGTVYVVRDGYTKDYMKKSTRMAVQSAMSDYDKNIYDNYGLYVMDSGYGLNRKSTLYEEKMDSYIKSAVDVKYCATDKSRALIGDNYITANDIEVNIRLYDCVKYDVCLLKKLIIMNERYHLSSNDMNRLITKNCYNNMSYEKIIIIEYLLQHFSSYKSININNQLNKNNLYEIEYIAYGKTLDRDNISEMMNYMGVDDNGISGYSYNNYMDSLREKLSTVSDELLCRRAWVLIVTNINNTYDKSINVANCFCSAYASCEYKSQDNILAMKFMKKLVANNINNQKISIYEDYSYFY